VFTETAIGTVATMWGDWPAYFAKSYKRMMQYNWRYLVKPGTYIHENEALVSWHTAGRNQIVEGMRGDWLLQLDTDHMFMCDILHRLLLLSEKYDAPVISGIYQYKFPPHAPVANLWRGDELYGLTEWDQEKDLIEIGSTGGGCLFVRSDVFKKISKELPGQRPFDLIGGLSEDYSFFKRCKDLKIPTYLAHKVECHHVIPNALSIKDYAKMK